MKRRSLWNKWKGKKQVRVITSGEWCANTTAICCAGEHLVNNLCLQGLYFKDWEKTPNFQTVLLKVGLLNHQAT